MSKLIVEVCAIDSIKLHAKAHKLELAIVKGFQTVVPKGTYKQGEQIVYIPYDSIVPAELSDRFGFTQYLSHGRVKVARLRGEPSYGVILPNELNKPIGTDVAELLGITKYIPHVRQVGSSGRSTDEESPHPLFPKYTEIENLRHYPDAFITGERVVVTEKLHGTSSRLAQIDGVPLAGSRRLQRKPPMKLKERLSWWEWISTRLLRNPAPTEIDCAAMGDNWVWFPWTIPSVTKLMEGLEHLHKQVVLFGEVFGKNVQKGMRYGSPDKLAFRAFDLLLDGKFMDHEDFVVVCDLYGVPTVPELFVGPYSLDTIKELSKGKTTVGDGETHIREGVVVRPEEERRDPRLGRLVLKYVSDDYLTSKDIGDFEDE